MTEDSKTEDSKKEFENFKKKRPQLVRKVELKTPGKRLIKGGFLGFHQEYMLRNFTAPAIWCRWSGIFAVSSALQRRTWVGVGEHRTFPNLYLNFVGPPATGKSVCADKGVGQFLSKVPGINLTPASITKEQLYVRMQERGADIVQLPDGDTIQQMAWTACIPELGTFIKAWDTELLDHLKDLWDSEKDEWDHETKNKGQYNLKGPCLGLLGGCTPRWLADTLGKKIFEDGFGSRTIYIYADKKRRLSTFRDPENQEIRDVLVHDLEAISNIAGKWSITPEAVQAISEWDDNDLEPAPIDHRLESYNGRRLHNTLKLIQAFAASDNGGKLEITLQNFLDARDALIEAEQDMHKAFKSFGENPLKTQVEATFSAIRRNYHANGRVVSEAIVRRAVHHEVAPHYFNVIIEQLERMEAISVQELGDMRVFKPKRETLE